MNYRDAMKELKARRQLLSELNKWLFELQFRPGETVLAKNHLLSLQFFRERINELSGDA